MMENVKISKKKGIARLFEIAGEKRYMLFISGIFSCFHALLMIVPYLASFFILGEFLNNYGYFENVNKAFILQWGLFTIGSICLAMACAYVGFVFSHFAAYRILYNTRLNLSRHIGTLSLGFLNKNSVGSIKKTLQDNVEKLEPFIAHIIPDMIISATTVIAMLIIMFYINTTLSIFFIICIAIIFLTQTVSMVGKKAQVLVKNYYDSLEEISNQSIEYVKGIATVKIFGKDIFSFKKFLTSIVGYKNLSLKFTDQFQNWFTLFKILSFSILSVLVPIGVYLYFHGHANKEFIFSLLFFVILTPAISSPLVRLLFCASYFRDLNEGITRIDKIFLYPSTREPTNPLIPTSYEVEFSEVNFSYHDNSDYALKNVSFKSCGTTALVGPSGGGKSTILNLVARFYDVKEGRVSIGGVNILDIPYEKLMEMVSFVFQDNFLFFDSVLENVRVARPNASMQEVYRACQLAQCDEFIQKLPKGYDTLIGEGGVYLSGGEEQRVCLARALLKDSPILILDEASSFSDAYNESQISKALKEISKNKVVFIIAHRLYLVKDVDQILVFEDGEIKERGKHIDLMNENSLYAKMYTVSIEVANYYFKNKEI